ncbi:hypothetical protein PVAP13_5NG577780 [Panicum virgatum]|uniref:Transmembrane protein n=1 Tax=Panicum virgatum TaxID=38727 RepID=A0A8T0S7L6_PANVG|nr:hypothetical protein PVAP13_5NG577780 [Panicum virgatum]
MLLRLLCEFWSAPLGWSFFLQCDWRKMDCPCLSFGSGVPVATTTDFVPVVSSLVDGGGRRGWGMLFVSVVGLASSGGLVSFYFRVSGSVAGCGASFRSPVSVMADMLGVFFFLRWQKEEDGRHKKEGVSPLRL